MKESETKERSFLADRNCQSPATARDAKFETTCWPTMTFRPQIFSFRLCVGTQPLFCPLIQQKGSHLSSWNDGISIMVSLRSHCSAKTVSIVRGVSKTPNSRMCLQEQTDRLLCAIGKCPMSVVFASLPGK
jgi:hypothetical protein